VGATSLQETRFKKQAFKKQGSRNKVQETRFKKQGSRNKVQETSVQETSVQETSVQETSVQETKTHVPGKKRHPEPRISGRVFFSIRIGAKDLVLDCVSQRQDQAQVRRHAQSAKGATQSWLSAPV
jgi:ribosomal protein L20A (L18A)